MEVSDFLDNKEIVFIIGGAFQGKTEYFKKNVGKTFFVNLSGKDNWEIIDFERLIDNGENVDKIINLSKNCGKECICVNNTQLLVKWALENQCDVVEIINKITEGKDKLCVIMTDVGNGIVPVEKIQRIYREEVGKFGCYIAGRAGKVIRVFCGIGSVIKG